MSSPNRVKIAIWVLIGLGLALYLARLHSHLNGSPKFEAALFLAVLVALVLPLVLWFRYLKSEGLYESAALALMAGVSSFTEWHEHHVVWGVTSALIALLFLIVFVRRILLLSKRDKGTNAVE